MSVHALENSTTSIDQAPSTFAENSTTSALHSTKDDIYQKNLNVIRFLLGKTLKTTSALLQTFAKASLTKRNPDPFQKQKQIAVADAMAKTVIKQLTTFHLDRDVDRYGYWNSILQVAENLLIDSKSPCVSGCY